MNIDDAYLELKHNAWREGKLAYKLNAIQKRIRRQILATDGMYAFLECGRGFGKCMKLDQLVCTPNGIVSIKSLRKGDFVIGSDGKPTRVVAVSEPQLKPAINLVRKGKIVATCSPEHRFPFYRSDMTIGLQPASKFIGNRNTTTLLRHAVEYPLGTKVVSDAYFLGAMIGNGCCTEDTRCSVKLSSNDERVVAKAASSAAMKYHKCSGKNYTWLLQHKKEDERSAHYSSWCHGKKSHQKNFDLEEVLSWNRESVLEFIAGLLDTDGFCDKGFRYYTGSMPLAQSLQELLYRLYQVKPYINTHTREGKSPEHAVILGNSWALRRLRKDLLGRSVSGRLEKLSCSDRNDKDTHCGVYFEPADQDVLMVDIQVDSDDSLFTLHDEGILTHNSVLLVLMALEDAIRDKRYPAVIVGPEVKQQIRIVHQILGLLTGDAPSGFVRKLRSNNEIAVGDNHIVIAGFNRDSIERLRGLRFTRAYLDEARNCKSEDFLYGIQDILIPTLGHANGTFRIGSSTPDELDHPLITYIAPKAELNKTHFVYTIDDNETLTTPQKVRLVEELGGKESEACQRELYCVRIRPRSRVALPDYRCFWEEASEDAKQFGNWIIFGDCGGTTDKTWLGLGFYDHPTARLYVLEERFFDANTASIDHAQAIGEFMVKIPQGQTPRIRIDMPGLLLVDFRKTHRIDVQNPVKPEFHQSLNQLNLAFRTSRIAIHPDCKFLKLCCEYGLLNSKRTDFERSETFGHCDPLAGLKYGWLSCDQQTNQWPVVRINSNQIRRQQPATQGLAAMANMLGRR